MKKVKWFLIIMVLAGFSFSCNNTTTKEKKSDAIDSTAIDTLTDKIAVVTFTQLNSDEAFELNGKTIKISGLVDHVCKHGGKRLILVGTNPDERIRVEAGDNLPFKEDIVGMEIEVIGKLNVEKIDSTYLANWENELKQKLEAGDNTVETKHIEGSGEHKQGEGEGQKDITEELGKIQQLKEEINTNDKGYILNMDIEFESMKQLK